MISNNLFKIRIRTMTPYANYVDETAVNSCSYLLQNADRKFSRKEFRIIKKSPKINHNPEE